MPLWRNLRHWTLHVVSSASASFIYASATDWNTRQAVAGMLGGIVFYITVYTMVWNSRWFRRLVPAGSTVDRSLLYGTRLRSAIGLVGPFSFFVGFGYVTAPDVFAGIMAVKFVEKIGRTDLVRALRSIIAGSDPHQRAQSMLVGDLNSLLPTFLITMTEGVLLSLILLILSLLCWLILRPRSRRKPKFDPDATLT